MNRYFVALAQRYRSVVLLILGVVVAAGQTILDLLEVVTAGRCFDGFQEPLVFLFGELLNDRFLVELFVREEVDALSHLRALQNCVAGGPVVRTELEALTDEPAQVVRIAGGKPVEYSFVYSLPQSLHVGGLEWRSLGCHFVDYTSQRPDVTLGVVGFVVPNLRAGIVGRASLSVRHPILRHYGYVEVAQLGQLVVLAEKHIRSLEITMEDVEVVENLEPRDHLNHDPPDLIFLKELPFFLEALNSMVEVTTRRELRYDAQAFGCVIIEGILIADYVVAADASEDAHFIEAVRHLSGRQGVELDLFQSVLLAIFLPASSVDHREGPLPQLTEDLELFQPRHLFRLTVNQRQNSTKAFHLMRQRIPSRKGGIRWAIKKIEEEC